MQFPASEHPRERVSAMPANFWANFLVYKPSSRSLKRVNNPTLTEFCFSMIGRADIEGSKKPRRYERLAATSQLSLW